MATFLEIWKEQYGEAYRQLVVLPKSNARSLLHYYLRQGLIKKEPCEVCGDPVVDGHHPDYNESLDVIWLCKKHHKELHSYDL
jgi:hypothetical protein